MTTARKPHPGWKCRYDDRQWIEYYLSAGSVYGAVSWRTSGIHAGEFQWHVMTVDSMNADEHAWVYGGTAEDIESAKLAAEDGLREVAQSILDALDSRREEP